MSWNDSMKQDKQRENWITWNRWETGENRANPSPNKPRARLSQTRPNQPGRVKAKLIWTGSYQTRSGRINTDRTNPNLIGKGLNQTKKTKLNRTRVKTESIELTWAQLVDVTPREKAPATANGNVADRDRLAGVWWPSQGRDWWQHCDSLKKNDLNFQHCQRLSLPIDKGQRGK